jgi:HAE1 family hydrophobic/amphiphilic exporter-1
MIGGSLGLHPGRLLEIAVLVVSIAASPLAASGQGRHVQQGPAPSVAEPLILTLEEALALGLKKNGDVQSALEYECWAKGTYIEERTSFLPLVMLEAAVARTKDESQKTLIDALPQELGPLFTLDQDRHDARIVVTQNLFKWGRKGAVTRGAKARIASSADQLRSARPTAARDIAAAFYDVLLAKEPAAIAEQNLTLKLRHRDETARRRSAGTATEHNVLAAEVAVDNARPESIRANNLVRVARDRLRFPIAVDREVDVSGDPHSTVAPSPDYETALATALDNRP